MDFSNYLANKLISATVRNLPYSTPETVWVSLYTSDPTKDNVGNEVEQASYSRRQATFNEPASGFTSNANQVDWSEATTNWGNITHIGICDSEVDGNLLYFTEIDNPKNILTGDQFRIKELELKLQLT